MHKYIFTITLLLLSFCLQSQASILGKVYFLNSKYETGKTTPGVNVQIRAEGSNGDYSKSDGSYSLRFDQMDAGAVVNIGLGNRNNIITDGNNKTLEWVNKKDLETATIPKTAAEKPIDIIVCPKGYRDLAAQKYYKIIKTSSDVALAQKERDYNQLLKAQKKDYDKLSQLSAELADLQKKTDSIAIYKEALFLASINKDNASKRVLTYLELLEEGKSIQDARKALSIKGAAIDLEESTKVFKAAVEELKTRAKASESIYDYQDAIMCYDTLIAYGTKMKIHRRILGRYHKEAGRLHMSEFNYEEGLRHMESAINILEDIPNSFDLGTAYHIMSQAFEQKGDLNNVLKWKLKATETIERNIAVSDSVYAIIYTEEQMANRYDSSLPILEVSYYSLALTYCTLGKKQEAIKYLDLGKTVNEKIKSHDKEDSNKLIALLAQSQIYNLIGEYEKAIFRQQEIIEIQEKKFGPDHQVMVNPYNNLALTYSSHGQYEKAEVLYLKAMKLQEKHFDDSHPNLIVMYSNLGLAYINLKQHHKALDYLTTALEYQEKSKHRNNSLKAKIFNNLAMANHRIEKHNLAVEYQEQAIKIQEGILDIDDPDLMKSYENMTYYYEALGNYTEAVNYILKHKSIKEKLLGKDHADMATTYYNLAYAYRKNEEFDLAVEMFRKSQVVFDKEAPKDHPVHEKLINEINLAIYEKGVAAFKLKDYDIAIDCFESLTTLNNGVVLDYLGLSYYFIDAFPEAIQAYTKSVEVMPELAVNNHYNNLGMAYAKNKQLDLAKECFEQYQKLFPDSGRSYRNWACYFALKGSKDEALSNLEKAIDLGFTDVVWLKKDRSIDALRKDKKFKALLERLEANN